MTIIRYKRTDLVFQSVGCLFLAGLGAYFAFQGIHWQIRLIGGLLALSLPVAAVALAMRAYADVPAIKYDQHKLVVATLWERAELPWPVVRRMHRETVQQRSALGLIKQDVGHYLVITAHAGDNEERTYKINERLLDWPRSALPRLIDDLAATAGWSEDAPIAANHRTDRVAGPTGKLRGFGRRGI